jgi:SAM-dependent methyltransferase
MEAIDNQKAAFDEHFADVSRYQFHVTADPLTRYVRDRRQSKAIAYLEGVYGRDALRDLSVLAVCGGIGGEAIYFKRIGFKKVTNCDLSPVSIINSKKLDPSLVTEEANAEALPYKDGAFDIVVVQDGLHHLPRPALGFTEMLRVAKKAVVVIEPKHGLVGGLIGTQFEKQGAFENYVFRWSPYSFQDVTKSYLLRKLTDIKFIALWDHTLAVYKVAAKFPVGMQVAVAKFIYGCFMPFSFCGNMMVGIVVKEK